MKYGNDRCGKLFGRHEHEVGGRDRAKYHLTTKGSGALAKSR